ncbi:unnamed protein product [Camellia sinensis]
MCSKVIQRSHPRFPLTATATATTRTSMSDPFLRFSFTTRLPKARVSIRTRPFRTKASFNDGSVASMGADTVSFYELLGVSETGTLVEIKQAYKQLARKYHPDVSPPDRVEDYTRRFIRVQEAYETLSDPRRRALYDSDMAKGLHLAFSARRRYHSHQKPANGRKKRVEDAMAGTTIRAEEKKHEQGCSWKYVVGSTNAEAEE